MNRTNRDFSDMIVKTYDNPKIHTKIYEAILNDSNIIKFINTNGILLITGCCGVWTFNREFHPSKDGYVVEHYWLEKLKECGNQQISYYSSTLTKEALESEIEELKYLEAVKEVKAAEKDEFEEGAWQHKEYINDRNNINSLKKQYYEKCLQEVDNEFMYVQAMTQFMRDEVDTDWHIFYKKIDYNLEVIFDIFEEMCRRM